MVVTGLGDNNMKALGWIAVIGGGYLVLKETGLLDQLLGTTPAALPTTSTTTNAGGNPAAVTQADTLGKLHDALVKANVDPGSYQTVDVWNYYYNQVRNIAGPAPEVLFVGVDRNKKYSLTEWWAGMTSQGFSGLGTIAHHVNPYINPVGNYSGIGHRPYQSNTRLRMFETYVINQGE